MIDLIIFLLFMSLGIFIALFLFSVLGVMTHVPICKGHKWKYDPDDTLRCEVCKKTFNEIVNI